jgi:hypothetical protein
VTPTRAAAPSAVAVTGAEIGSDEYRRALKGPAVLVAVLARLRRPVPWRLRGVLPTLPVRLRRGTAPPTHQDRRHQPAHGQPPDDGHVQDQRGPVAQRGHGAQHQQQAERHHAQQDRQPRDGEPRGPCDRLVLQPSAGDHAVDAHRRRQQAGGGRPEEQTHHVHEPVALAETREERGEGDGEQKDEKQLDTGEGDPHLTEKFAPQPVKSLLRGLPALAGTGPRYPHGRPPITAVPRAGGPGHDCAAQAAGTNGRGA